MDLTKVATNVNGWWGEEEEKRWHQTICSFLIAMGGGDDPLFCKLEVKLDVEVTADAVLVVTGFEEQIRFGEPGGVPVVAHVDEVIAVIRLLAGQLAIPMERMGDGGGGPVDMDMIPPFADPFDVGLQLLALGGTVLVAGGEFCCCTLLQTITLPLVLEDEEHDMEFPPQLTPAEPPPTILPFPPPLLLLQIFIMANSLLLLLLLLLELVLSLAPPPPTPLLEYDLLFVEGEGD